MRDNVINSKFIALYPKFLWFVILTYSMLTILVTWFSSVSINLFGLDANAGLLVFPLTILLSGLVAEVYGYKHARRMMWCGFFFSVLFIVFEQAIVHMPSPPYSTNNVAFDTLLTANIKNILVLGTNYFISQSLNIFIIAKLKTMMKGNHLSIRLALSTVVVISLSSIIFSFGVFPGAIYKENLASLIFSMYCITFLFTPFLTCLIKKLKKSERLDIYDKKTNFNILRFDVVYYIHDNEFGDCAD